MRRHRCYAVLLGLVGAGIVHIAVLLLVPQFSERDAWSRLAMASGSLHDDPARRRSRRRADGEVGRPAVLCRRLPVRSDRRHGPGQGAGQRARSGRSRSTIATATTSIPSTTTAPAGAKLDAVVLTPAQMIEVRKDLAGGSSGIDLRRGADRRRHRRRPQLRPGRQLEADRVALPRTELLRRCRILTLNDGRRSVMRHRQWPSTAPACRRSGRTGPRVARLLGALVADARER